MNRPTKSVGLPISGMTAIVYEYYLRGDRKEIEQIMLNSAKYEIDPKTDKPKFTGVDSSYRVKMEDKAVLLALKEFKKGAEIIVPTIEILDGLPSEDFDILQKALPNRKPKKK